MIQIPDQFRENASYFYAARALETINKPTAAVLYHVFADRCKEILESNDSPELESFLEIFTKQLPPFPPNGPSEVRFVAGELYGALLEKLQEGKINSHMPEQFILCSKLYSILDGENCVLRETRCRVIAAQLQVLFRNLKQKKEEEEAKKAAEEEARLKAEAANAKQTMPARSKSEKIIPHENILTQYSDPPQLQQGYDQNHIIHYLMATGYNPHETKAPKFNENLRGAIQKYLDLGVSCLKRGDKEMGLEFLQKAKAVWTTGRDQ